jgi:hypothetical protein
VLGAIATGGLIYTAFGDRRPSDEALGDAIISLGGLGDHIRMLNTYARMTPPVTVDVVTNDNAAGLDGLFSHVAVRSVGGTHGAALLAPAFVARAGGARARYSRSRTPPRSRITQSFTATEASPYRSG